MKILELPGNIGALKKWIASFSTPEFIPQDEIERLGKGDILVLPGGNIGALPNEKVKSEIKSFVKRGGRLFAICGTFQSLFTSGEEGGSSCYLEIFPGISCSLKDPNIGFCNIDSVWFNGRVYFNCKYGVSLNSQDKVFLNNIGVKTMVDDDGILLGVKSENILGVQFHPELSNGSFNKVFLNWVREK